MERNERPGKNKFRAHPIFSADDIISRSSKWIWELNVRWNKNFQQLLPISHFAKIIFSLTFILFNLTLNLSIFECIY